MTDTNSKIIVYVSILNWNAAKTTLTCISSLLKSKLSNNLEMQIFVVDNASAPNDFQTLEADLDPQVVHLLRNEVNSGFAGGHNLTIKKAIDNQADFIWLLNNDTTITANTLSRLVASADSDPQVGAVSPLLVAAHDDNHIDFCGGIHDWKALEAVKLGSLVEERQLNKDGSKDTWLSGAALLLRVSALSMVGLLDETMFAYYEDNDISCKLLNAGWEHKVAFDCIVYHETSTDVYAQRPPYYFYLMSRNSFIFWKRHTPMQYRRFLRLRLLDREMFIANRLISKGFDTKAQASLLGIWDGLINKYGKPNLDRPWISIFMRLFARLLMTRHKKIIFSRLHD